jgi:hypothetical protein
MSQLLEIFFGFYWSVFKIEMFKDSKVQLCNTNNYASPTKKHIKIYSNFLNCKKQSGDEQ